MKKLLFLMLSLYFFCAATTILINGFDIHFADHEEYGRLLDEYFFFLSPDVSRNQTLSKKLFIFLQAIFISEVVIGIGTTVTIVLCPYIHLRIKLQKAFDGINYGSAIHLQDARGRISDVQQLMENLNKFSGDITATGIILSMLISALAVHCFLGEDGLPSKFTANCVALAVAFIVFTSLTWASAIMFVDVNSSCPVRRVYEVSAQVDPEDDDYAMQAELLAKQLEQTPIILTVWTFCKVKRIAIINVYASYFSYCFLSIQLNQHFASLRSTLQNADAE